MDIFQITEVENVSGLHYVTITVS